MRSSQENENGNGNENMLYFYAKCPDCGNKLHIGTIKCPHCGADYWLNCLKGKWTEIYYGSHDPQNEIFGKRLNRADQCMRCQNVTDRKLVCDYAFCFATGKGKCELCRKYDYTRFSCCQKTIPQDKIELGKFLPEPKTEKDSNIVEFIYESQKEGV